MLREHHLQGQEEDLHLHQQDTRDHQLGVSSDHQLGVAGDHQLGASGNAHLGVSGDPYKLQGNHHDDHKPSSLGVSGEARVMCVARVPGIGYEESVSVILSSRPRYVAAGMGGRTSSARSSLMVVAGAASSTMMVVVMVVVFGSMAGEPMLG